MDPAATRAEAAERQRLWMQQRQAELDRRAAQESLGMNVPVAASSTATSSAPPAAVPGGAVVLDRLAEQIAARLQVEVRKENARIMQDGAVGAQVESLLERHIASNNCPVCFELMSGTEHAPTLLFPCGHTFCAACLHQHLDKLGRKTCPYCREKVQSQAPNVALRQVIDGFVERQQALSRGEVLPELVQGQENVAAAAQQRHEPPSGSLHGGVWAGDSHAQEASKYADQYRAYSMRCRVMRNQLVESRAEGDGLRSQLQSARAVLHHLTQEEQAARDRLEAARVELELVQAQRVEQATKCEAVVTRQQEIEQMEQLVDETYSSLHADRQKSLLLLRNFSPDLADRLQQEFEDADVT